MENGSTTARVVVVRFSTPGERKSWKYPKTFPILHEYGDSVRYDSTMVMLRGGTYERFRDETGSHLRILLASLGEALFDAIKKASPEHLDQVGSQLDKAFDVYLHHPTGGDDQILTYRCERDESTGEFEWSWTGMLDMTNVVPDVALTNVRRGGHIMISINEIPASKIDRGCEIVGTRGKGVSVPDEILAEMKNAAGSESAFDTMFAAPTPPIANSTRNIPGTEEYARPEETTGPARPSLSPAEPPQRTLFPLVVSDEVDTVQLDPQLLPTQHQLPPLLQGPVGTIPIPHPTHSAVPFETVFSDKRSFLRGAALGFAFLSKALQHPFDYFERSGSASFGELIPLAVLRFGLKESFFELFWIELRASDVVAILREGEWIPILTTNPYKDDETAALSASYLAETVDIVLAKNAKDRGLDSLPTLQDSASKDLKRINAYWTDLKAFVSVKVAWLWVASGPPYRTLVDVGLTADADRYRRAISKLPYNPLAKLIKPRVGDGRGGEGTSKSGRRGKGRRVGEVEPVIRGGTAKWLEFFAELFPDRIKGKAA